MFCSFYKKISVMLTLWMLVSTSLIAATLEGRVVSISDGDTLTLLTAESTQLKIRLAGIDTPEKSQAFGTKAKQALSDKVFGQDISVEHQGKDRYGRIIGDIYYNQRWINLEMVQEGFAWHYKQYSKSPALSNAELQARAGKKQLWSDPNPIAPWNYRKAKKSVPAPTVSPKAITGYWLNTSTGSRHNSNCRYYQNTAKGRACSKSDGKGCGSCGG